MPDVGDVRLHAHAVDDIILQQSSQGCFSRCFKCFSGVKSELFNACLDCRELLQDVKFDGAKAPLLVEPTFWGAAEDIPPVPVTCPDDLVVNPFSVSAPCRMTRLRSSCDDAARGHLGQARSPPRRSPTSPYRTQHSQRGRPPNGSRRGPPGFKGVRQRKGVRGYLVEIRPPKWKRTIWLGTYNTDREAAGAYDAGVFYTHKKTKYNFPALKGTFRPLPSQLDLANPADSDEIKLFVQGEARLAAQKVQEMLPAESSATSSVTTQNGPAAGAMSMSSEECSEPRETGDMSSMGVPSTEVDWLSDWYRDFLFEELVNPSQHSVCQMDNWMKQEFDELFQ